LINAWTVDIFALKRCLKGMANNEILISWWTEGSGSRYCTTESMPWQDIWYRK